MPQDPSIPAISPAQVADIGNTRKRLVIYGVVAVVLGLVLIVSAIAIGYVNKTKSAVINNQLLELLKQKELENEQLQIEAAIEAEILMKEHEATLAKIKQEKETKEAAEKLAIERAALTMEAAKKKEKKIK